MTHEGNHAAGFHKWGCGPRARAVFYIGRSSSSSSRPFSAPTKRTTGDGTAPSGTLRPRASTRSFGAHPDAHFIALGDAIAFLEGLGGSRIQARLFHLTSRWVRRVEAIPRFRAAVTLQPDHCAGLVAWELEGVEKARVREALVARNVLVGGTESYAGFFGIPEDRPRSLFISNAEMFTSNEDVDRLAEEIEASTRA
jgi:selenocysteine lyase/cysteine desulfurase